MDMIQNIQQTMANLIKENSLENIVKSNEWTLFSTIGIPIITIIIKFLLGKIKRVIVVQRRDNTISDKGIEFIRLFVEMIKVILPMCIWYVVINLVNIILMEKFREKIGVCILLLIVMLVFSRIAYVYRRKRKFYLCVCNILLICAWMLSVIFAFNISNVMLFLGAITFITIVYLLIIEYVLYKKGYYDSYGRSRLAKGMLIVRNLIIIFYICYLSFSMQVFDNAIKILNAYEVIIIGWLIFCSIEWICLYEKNQKNIVEYDIVLSGKIEHSKQSVIQYMDTKVKYILNDGTVKIIDNEEIVSIEYIMTKFFKRKAIKRGCCLLKSGMKFYFDEYKYLSNLWVGFYTIKNKEKEAIVIHSSRISEIIEPKRLYVLLQVPIIRYIVRASRRRQRVILGVIKRVKNEGLEIIRRYCIW